MHILRNSLLFGRVLLIASGLALTMAGDTGNQEAVRLSGETCTSLQGFSVPASAIGLPASGAVVKTAEMIHASDKDNKNGEFCKVTGIVKPHNPTSPNLEFEV